MLIRATKFEEELLRDLRKCHGDRNRHERHRRSVAFVLLMLTFVPSVVLDEVYGAWQKTRTKVCHFLAEVLLCPSRLLSSRRWVRFAQARVPMSCRYSLFLNHRDWHWHATAVCHCLASRLREVIATQTFLDVRGVFEWVCLCFCLFLILPKGCGER